MASFADYVKDLMAILPQVDGNPMLSATSMTDNASYRENPFYRQDEINARDKLVLDEEERIRLASAQAQGAQGMMGGGGGGDSPQTKLTPAQIAYFDAETDMERDTRMNNLFSGIAAPLAGLLGGPLGYGIGSLVPNSAPVYSGQVDYSTRSPALIQQQVQLQQTLMADEQRKRESAQVAMAEEANRAAINAQAASRMQRQEGVGGGGGESNMPYGGSTGSNVGTSNPNSYSSSRSSGSIGSGGGDASRGFSSGGW